MSGQVAVTIATAAALTELTPWQVREAIHEGRLPARRIGRSTRVLVADLERWFEGLPLAGAQ